MIHTTDKTEFKNSLQNEAENPWSIINSREIHNTPWIKVMQHDVINPAGKPDVYTTVNFKNVAVGIVAITSNDELILVGQYRFPVNRYSWEIPEGGGALDEPPLLSAQRELKEETGYIANKWELLHEMDVSNSVSNEHAFIFLATELESGPAMPDEAEQLQVMKLPFEEAVQWAQTGKISDSISLVAIFKLALLRQNQDNK